MISTAELSELLENLYSAPLESSKWQAFLDRLCSLCSVSAGYLVSHSRAQGNAILAGGGLNFDPEILHLYNEYYGAMDPYDAPFTAKGRTGLIHGEELVAHSVLIRTKFYNELLARYGLEYMSVLSSKERGRDGEIITLWRSAQHGRPEGTTIDLIEGLIPHIRIATLLRRKLAGSEAALAFSEAALDVMSIAAFLVNSKGEIKHMNRMASSYLGEGGCLRLEMGRLTENDPSVLSGRLSQLIAQAASTKAPTLDCAPGGALRLSNFNITVVPAPEQNEIAGRELYALVFVTDTRQPVRSRATVMRQLYRLTPSEARVTDGLLDGLEVREIAESLGMSLETCRFHLKRVFAKTGTHRQIELIRLMLSLPGQ